MKKKEKEDPSEKKKLCFCHFLGENCAKKNSKTQVFVYQKKFCQLEEQQQGE